MWEWEHGATTEGAVAMMCERLRRKSRTIGVVCLSPSALAYAPSTESRLGGRATTRKPSCVWAWLLLIPGIPTKYS